MAMPRLPLLPPPPGSRRRAAAWLLTLAVLALHLAGLQATMTAWPEQAAPPVAEPLRLQVRPVVAARTAARDPVREAPARARPAPAPAIRPDARPAPTPVARTAPAQPDPTAAGAPRLSPVYAAVLPPAATRHYRLQQGDRDSPARLTWSHDARGYRLSLMAEGGELDGLGAASHGHVGPGGLVPERHVERRRGRDQRATNFDLASGQVRGSGGGTPHPWPAGGQDRLSWLLQLAAVLQADAALARPGAQVVLPVAGPRGPSATWVFAVRGTESVTLADGRSASGVALHRAAQHPYDLQVDVWLDPGDHHLPLRLRLTAPPGDWQSLWLSQVAP